MKNILSKVLSLLISILMIIEILPLSVWAKEYTYANNLLNAELNTKNNDSQIVGEIVEYRDANQKVYLKQDGSYTAIVSDGPMHFYDDGEWKEIDNTLSEENGIISNESNSFSVDFPKELSSKDEIVISSNDNELSFLMNNVLDAEAEILNDSVKDNAFIPELESTVEYSNILSDTDLKYEIGADLIKESIILSSCPGRDVSYSYDIKSKGNNIVLNEDKSLTISNNKDVLFEVQKPIMYDANGSFSNSIETTLSCENGVYKLTYKPDFDWMSSEDRAFPVTVDPTIKINKGNAMTDAVIGTYTDNNGTLGNNYKIEKTSNTESKLCLKLNDSILSSLGNNVAVTKAELSMYCKAESNLDTLAVYAVDDSWNDTDSDVTKDNRILDYNIIENSAVQKRYVWDITEAAADWALGQHENNGVVIEALNDNSCSTLIENTSSAVYTSHRPWFEINYEIIDNAKDYDSETIDMGRAGTLYLNKYTGTYYVQRTDISLGGNVSPVSMSFSFDPWSEARPTNAMYGAHWYIDYFNKIFYLSTIVDDNGDTRHSYYLYDSLGLITRFNEVLPSDDDYENIPEEFTVSNAENYVRYKSVFGNPDKCLWVPKTDTTYRDFTNMIIEDSEYSYTIDSRQRISTIINKKDRSVIVITPVATTSSSIGNVIDGVGRKYAIPRFNDVNHKTLADKLVVYNSSNNLIKVNTSSGNVAVGVDYNYQPVNSNMAYLTGISYPDGENIYYEYTADGKISSITNVDNSRLELIYTNGRVTGYIKYAYYVSANSSQNCIESRYEASFDSAKQRTYKYYEYDSTTPSEVVCQKYNKNLEPTDSINLNGDFSYTQTKTVDDVETISFSSNDKNASNLLANGSFNSSGDWTMLPSSNAGVYTCSDTGSFSDTDTHVCRMTGNGIGANIRVAQTISTLNANTEDKVYTVSAWAKSETACANNYAHDYSHIDKTFALCVLDGDNNVLAQYDYDTYCNEWQFGAVSFKVSENLSDVKVVLAFDNQSVSSTAFFDTVKLYETDSSYVYTDEEELTTQSASSTVVYDGEQYRTKPCDFCSCAQCSTSKTETINGIETQLYYNCSCDSDDENNNCACLGCRQERSRTTAKNSYGLTTRESQNYNGKELFTEYNYTSNSNYLASTVGSDGKAVYYNYNADTGLLDSYGYEQNCGNIVNPVTYSYNAVGALLSVSQTATDLNNSNLTIKSDYTYNGDKLTSVSHDGTSYSFEYDHYGNTTSAKVNGNNIVNYTYPDHRNVGSITYANGLTISYHYDQDKNITSLKYNNAEKFAYEYTDGVLSKSVDFANMLVTYYSDDTTVTKRFTLNGENIVDGETVYSYNSENNTETVFGLQYSLSDSEERYDSSNDTVISMQSLTCGDNSIVCSGTTDFFNRTLNKTLRYVDDNENTTELKTQYTYSDTDTVASNEVVGLENKLNNTTISSYTYSYDNSGNITEVRDNGSLLYKYVYDEAGQVVKDYNFAKAVATTYTYDNNGNILSKTPYTNVTSADLSTATQGTAITYSYDTSWSDKLISYNGQSIVYDSIGNPTSYKGATLTWSGRFLTSYEKGSDRYEYSYNEDGLRVEKKYYSNNTLNDVCTYVWKNGKLIAQKKYVCKNDDCFTITYLYDGEEAIGFVYDGLMFFYIKNIQGDITAIALADTGKLALTVSYDAWGNPVYSIVVDDNADVWERPVAFLRAVGIMGLNNYAYRGYFYDTETGLYYLQSRYYDPEVGRFINLDDTSIALATIGEMFSSNLYIYCYNNAVNNYDFSGYIPVKDLNELFKKYSGGKSIVNAFSELIKGNGKAPYTAFHELAQVIIAITLVSEFYYVELEKKCNDKKSEMDIYAERRVRQGVSKYMWEVKPLGTSGKEQLKKYKSLNPDINLGFKHSEISRSLMNGLSIKITFDGAGGAFYAFYKNGKKRVTNAELKRALDTSSYKFKQIGMRALNVAILAAAIASGVCAGYVISNLALSSITQLLPYIFAALA